MPAAAYQFLLALLMLLGSAPLFATDAKNVCGERTALTGTVFTLTVDRSFEPGVIFKLCDREDKANRFLLVSTQSSGHEDKWDTKSIPLELVPGDTARIHLFQGMLLDTNRRIGRPPPCRIG